MILDWVISFKFCGVVGELHWPQYFLLHRSTPLFSNQINSSRVIFRGDNGAKVLELPVTKTR